MPECLRYQDSGIKNGKFVGDYEVCTEIRGLAWKLYQGALNNSVLWYHQVFSSNEMNLSLEKKQVVITGGTKGIGLAIVKGFLLENAIVHVIARTTVNSDIFLKDCNAEKSSIFFYQCDTTNEQSVKKTVEEISANSNGRIDIVVANVGSGKSVTDPIPTSEHWNKIWDINFNTALNTARSFADVLRVSRGSLLFISSIAGVEVIGAPVDYSVAKSALNFLTKSLSRSLAPDIRVNAVVPGNVWAEDGTWGNKMREKPEQVQKMLDEKVPLKRFGTAEEIANLVLFISSPQASFITGGIFIIDGGQTTSI
jgi:3-oxoacyl-[acyl-carrier protein] reductase